MDGDRAVGAGDAVARAAGRGKGRLEVVYEAPADEIQLVLMACSTYCSSLPLRVGSQTGMIERRVVSSNEGIAR